MKYAAGIWLFIFPCMAIASNYVLSPNCQSAYKQIWEYQIPQALHTLHNERQDNLLGSYLRETAYFMQALATESPADIARFNTQNSNALEDFDNGSDNSPWYFYAKAEAHLHHAIIGIIDNDYLSAAYDINKSYRLLVDGREKFGIFPPIQKDLLLLKAAIGSVPDNYQWMVSILGFNGNLKQNAKEYDALLEQLDSSEEYHIFLSEAQIYDSYIHYYLLNDTAGAWDLIQKGAADYAGSPLKAFLLSSMAIRLKKNDFALELLAQSPAAFPLLDYEHGMALLHSCDKAGGTYLARFIRYYQGNNYLKDAYLHLGWAFLLDNDMADYHNCMRLVQSYGTATMEEDADALKEASRPDAPNIHLLKARLYFDGGYFDDAKNALSGFALSKASLYNQAEYYYRQGRISEALENTDNALTYYNKLITTSRYAQQSYFAPAACLYSAMIWEKRNNTLKAAAFYKRVMTYKKYPYKNSFGQKAKAGLKRLGY